MKKVLNQIIRITILIVLGIVIGVAIVVLTSTWATGWHETYAQLSFYQGLTIESLFLLLQPFSGEPNANEYEIYNFCLQELSKQENQPCHFLLARSAFWPEQRYKVSAEEFESLIKSKATPHAATEIIDDFYCKNGRSHPIKISALRCNCKIETIPSAYMVTEVGLERFNLMYEDQKEVIIFSRVGFDNNNSYALLYFELYSWFCGYYLLERENSSWQIINYQVAHYR